MAGTSNNSRRRVVLRSLALPATEARRRETLNGSTMAKRRTLKLNPHAWLNDPRISKCQPASRAVWLALLWAMRNQGERRICCTAIGLSRVARCSENEVVEAARDLRRCEVTNVEFVGNTIAFDYRLPSVDRLPDADWRVIRIRILKRDGHKCRYCRKRANSVDHVTPHSRGGSDNDENLVACCRSCNSRKKDRTPREAKMVLHG